MSTGTVVQVIGAVVDVEFPRDSIPKVYDALKLQDRNLTLEVQQQLGDGVVRTIAMGTSEGLRRGLAVANTGKAISVPVGPKTLGRIMNVLGEPIDDAGEIGAQEAWPIHREAPSYDGGPRGRDHEESDDRQVSTPADDGRPSVPVPIGEQHPGRECHRRRPLAP